MQTYPLRIRAFAYSAATLAGFVDAIGFLQLGGFFVSFMSGNSTRLGVGSAFDHREALIAGGMILSFLLGVILGSSLARLFPRAGRLAILAGIAGLLVAAVLAEGGGATWLAGAALAAGMGALNPVLEENGETRVGLTYMTGALVKLGQRIVSALFGGDRLGWLPYLVLWGALTLGAVSGALAFRAVGLTALWAAVVGVGGLALLIGSGRQKSG